MTTEQLLTDLEERLGERFKHVEDKVDKMYKRTFEGNGNPPLTVQIDRLNRFKVFGYWMLSLISVASLGMVVRMVILLINR